MAKKIDFKTYTEEQLQKFVTDKREALRSLRFSVAGSKNRNVKEGKGLRKDIARALTRLSAKK